jgi:glucosylceramidase
MATAMADAQPLAMWTSTPDGSQRMARSADLTWTTTKAQGTTVEIAITERHQTFLGVGAAMTDSSAALIQHRLDATSRDDLLREFFDPTTGIGLDWMRVTIGGSDFSSRHYSLDDTPDNAPDPTLSHYADQPETIEVRDLAIAAKRINPSLKIMASPWSAPAWMKSPVGLIGGRLQPAYYDAFADYLLRFADGYAAAGVPLTALTVQNEPAYEAPTYASMRVDAEERARFIGSALGPKLAQRANAPALLEWDHNWSQPGSPLAVLAHPEATRYLAGVAWHCYGGLPIAQRWVQAAAPTLDAYITECSSGDWQREWPDTFRSMIGTVLIEGIRNGARAVLLWNLALDEDHGPHVGGCRNCRGLITLAQDGGIERHAEYVALAHLGRFVRPGATVVGSTSVRDGVRSVAFVGADGVTLTVLLQNATAQAETVTLKLGAHTASLSLAPGVVATVTGPCPDDRLK